MKDLLNNKLVWLAVVAVAGVGIWLGTKGDNKSGDKSSNLSINSAVQDKCNSQISDSLFCKFAGTFANAGAYKVNVTSTDKSGSQDIQLATDANGNSSMVIKKNGQEQASIVYFNKTTYLKDPSDGKWIQYPADAANSPQIIDLKTEFVKGDFNKNSDGNTIAYKKVGTETCGSLQCYKYQVNESGKTAQSGYIWFDTSDYLLRRVSINANGTATDMDVLYADVNVSQPSPTKSAQ